MADLGLFTAPEDIQRARLMQEAQMTPNQRLYMMGAKAGQQLGQGVGSLFGVDVQDPTVARATKLRELGAKYGTTTAEALDKIAAELQQTDPQMAMQVAAKARELKLSTAKLESENALTQQRMREKQSADPFQQFLRSAVGKVEPASLAAYRLSGDPADLKWIDKEAKQSFSELGKLISERNALNPATNSVEIKAYNDKIKKLTSGGGIGSEIAAGLSPVLGAIVSSQTKAGGTEAGKAAGKIPETIEGKYEALYAIQDATSIFGKGIYAGGFGPAQEVVSKYGMGILGNKKRLANTQEFKAYLADTVIPRLKEFGGSDTVEELKYLQAASGANTDIEPEALQGILKRVELKIQRGIDRSKRQYSDLTGGKAISIQPEQRAKTRTAKTASGVTYTIQEEE